MTIMYTTKGAAALRDMGKNFVSCIVFLLLLLLAGWDLRHQVLRPLLAYCTAPDDR
jgi:hypothetical protein